MAQTAQLDDVRPLANGSVAVVCDAATDDTVTGPWVARLPARWWLAPLAIDDHMGRGTAATAWPGRLDADARVKAEARIRRAVPRGAHPAFVPDVDPPPSDAQLAVHLAPVFAAAHATAQLIARTLPPALAAARPTYDVAWLRALCARIGVDVLTDVVLALGTLGPRDWVELGVLAEVGDHAAYRAAEAARKSGMLEALAAWRREGHKVPRPRPDRKAKRGAHRSGEPSLAAVEAAYTAACELVGAPPAFPPTPAPAPATDADVPPALLVVRAGSRLGPALAAYYYYASTPASTVAYAFDAAFVSAWARANRRAVLAAVWREVRGHTADMGALDVLVDVESDGVDWAAGVVRRRAVPAGAGKAVLMACNLRDGVLWCGGRGCKAWHGSAPAGAARRLHPRRHTPAAFERALAAAGVVATSLDAAAVAAGPGAVVDADALALAAAPGVVIHARYATAVHVR